MAFNFVKRTSIIVGAIALTTLPPAGVLAAPQTPSTTAPTPAVSITQQLNLSNQQIQKIKGIRTDTVRQVVQVLTSPQRTKLQQELNTGKKMGAILRSMDLNANQQKRLLGIVQNYNRSVEGVLNSQQRQKLEAYRKQRQMNSQTPIE